MAIAQEARHRAGGLDTLLDPELKRAAIDEIARSSTLARWADGDGYTFTYAGSDLSRAIGSTKRLTVKQVAKRVFEMDATALVGDVSLAKALNMPMVQAAEVYRRIHLEHPHDSSAGAVALSLRLPVVQHVPVAELLKLRQDHWPELQRFRAALRAAIQEQMATHATGSDADIATSVVRDYIEPELAKIEQQLIVAKSVLERKVALNVVVGTVAASMGLTVGAPLVLGAGVTALATAVRQGNKYFDEAGTVEMSDLHFLWRARRLTSQDDA